MKKTLTTPGVHDAHKEAVLETQRLAETPMTREEIVLVDILSRAARDSFGTEEYDALRHAAYRLEKLENDDGMIAQFASLVRECPNCAAKILDLAHTAAEKLGTTLVLGNGVVIGKGVERKEIEA